MISEPTTLLTDWLLGALALVWSARLWRTRSTEAVRACWAGAFAGTGVAALAGGAHHGFQLLLAPLVTVLLWKVTLVAVVSAGFFFYAGTALATFPARPARALIAALVVAGVAYVPWILVKDEFVHVLVWYAPALVFIAVAATHARLAYRSQSAPWLLAGVAVSAIASLVQYSGFALHRHFNHNDLYHVVQIAGLYLLYRGGRLLGDRRGIASG